MAAEDERKKRLVRFAGLGRLLGNFQVAVRLGFERRPDRIAPGQELVQPEGEEGKAAGFVSTEAGALEEPTAEHLGATLRPSVRQPRGRPRRWCSGAALRYGSSRSGVRDPCVRQRRWCSGAALRYGSSRSGVRDPCVRQRRWCPGTAFRHGSSRSGVRDPCVRQRRWCSGAALRRGAHERRELQRGGRLATPVRLAMIAPDRFDVPAEPAGASV